MVARPVQKIMAAAKFILIDWTVSPRMLELDRRRPFLYQFITTPVITLVWGGGGLLLLAAILTNFE